MSGHSKWANIRFRKAAQDAKRGKIFTKLIREITTAARMGGGDESSNPRLRSAVVSALAQNMTRDTIKRAIERGVGGGEGADLETIVYEGYGVGGVGSDSHRCRGGEIFGVGNLDAVRFHHAHVELGCSPGQGEGFGCRVVLVEHYRLGYVLLRHTATLGLRQHRLGIVVAGGKAHGHRKQHEYI